MSDRGTEFFNLIRFTTMASYSPHENTYVERGHAITDRALERMMTADPALKPEVALLNLLNYYFRNKYSDLRMLVIMNE